MLNKKQDYCINVCKSKCCKQLHIAHSPTTLEKKYIEWLNTGKIELHELHLIYPMLQFLKKDKNDKKRPYVYKCKMLIDGKCSIYKHRPYMCSGFGVNYPVDGFSDCIYSNDSKENGKKIPMGKKMDSKN